MLREIRDLLFGPPMGRPSTVKKDPVVGAVNETYRLIFDPGYAEQQEEERRRRDWFSKRLWHNGEHAHCCKKCFQAGYVIAAALAERPDLIRKYPELIPIFDKLDKDGMLETAFAKTRGYSTTRRR